MSFKAFKTVLLLQLNVNKVFNLFFILVYTQNDILCCPATDLVKNVSYHKLMRRLALRMAVVDTTFKMNCKAVVAWSDQPE